MTARVGRLDRLDPDELAGLEEQRDFLLRSLEDLEREYGAGDLSDDDYATLRDDYTARAAETLRALDEKRVAFADARNRGSRKRTLGTLAAVVVFAAVAGLLVANSIGARKAGDTITGGVTTKSSPSQRAQACIPKINTEPTKALACFKGVLDDDPFNVVALTWTGWALELTSGQVGSADVASMQATAADYVERAVKADPEYSYARAFRAVLAFRHGNYQQAKTYLAEFRAGDPSPDAESVITSFDLDGRIKAALADKPPA